MKNFIKITWLLLIVLTAAVSAKAQLAAQEPDRFDFGKMWAFEYLPLDYFQQTYNFRPDEAWIRKTRMSSLRFATFCSASFISPNGLIMTNHHCSRGEMGKVMKTGEDFDKNGFYATTQALERRVEGLFVKQLVQIKDVTKEVTDALAKAQNDAQALALRDTTLDQLTAQYEADPAWKGLEIEPVTYFNGGRFSLYGYKKYDDIRLVMIPELQLGYFGGDPDNFTYPRYTLDYTLWRAYENGKPVNSTANYFKFNTNGVKEGEPVFVIGNPGSTERYRTVAQLEYDRDYRYKILLTALRDQMQILQDEYRRKPSHGLQEQIFELSNSVKAYEGVVAGLNDSTLMARKRSMENYIKSRSNAVKNGKDYWQQIADQYKPLYKDASEITLLAPGAGGSKTLLLLHYLNAYRGAAAQGAGAGDLAELRTEIKKLTADLDDPIELRNFATLLRQVQQFASADDAYIQQLLKGQTPDAVAANILQKTAYADSTRLDSLLAQPPVNDPLLQTAGILLPAYQKAAQNFGANTAARRALERQVGNEVYQIYGLNIPPDATFTLRLADGVVKSYEYNGTTAPIQTTYYGMYDRHYGFNKQFPWSLPPRWANPPTELLRSPLDFISTNDIIGGNSGSPIINKNAEVVGLVFDGNIESLPGNFIFDPTENRTISVHAGGIAAALKHIYKADRILQELGIPATTGKAPPTSSKK
jgi:hypothetical protein